MLRSFLLCLLIVISVGSVVRVARPIEQDGVAVRFSPDGGCADAVLEAMRGARRTLDVACYHITHADIARAMIDANRRGISVRVVMDQSQAQQKYSSATTLHNNGVPVLIWPSGLMHNKYVIVDGKTIVTGSYNFTKGGDRENAENLLVIRDRPRIAAAYRQNFDRLVKESTRYTGISAK